MPTRYTAVTFRYKPLHFFNLFFVALLLSTIVEHHPGRPEQEPGFTLEVFNAVGKTVDVVTVREWQIEPLTEKSVLHVRPLAQAV